MRQGIWGEAGTLKPFLLCLLISFMVFSPALTALCGQQADPYYSRLLLDGENSFLVKNYEEALKKLELAAFGLHGEKKLLGKAFVYLGLGYYYLKNNEKSREYLMKALPIINDLGMDKMEIHPSAKESLANLLGLFKLEAEGEQMQKEQTIELFKEKDKREAVAPKQPAPLPRPDTSNKSAIELEKRISEEPYNISLYYQLYDIYRTEKNVTAAKALLGALIKNNPNELSAYYLLAKIEFSQNNLESALERFNQLIKLLGEAQVSNEVILKSMMHVSVCLYRLNKRQDLQSFVNLVEESTTDEQLTKMLREEGLERDWKKIKNTLR